ncbi:hypothetical protein Psi01_09630 [Planobispora siamensis]|uniref:Uncharacterized protein n=1 Tax=Planobispora siamensis TaxID=936338 RepID=A0A8J3WI93_9ACTN|nr:hypothetical protein Psi01_09630 [Planobispora siamensis]
MTCTTRTFWFAAAWVAGWGAEVVWAARGAEVVRAGRGAAVVRAVVGVVRAGTGLIPGLLDERLGLGDVRGRAEVPPACSERAGRGRAAGVGVPLSPGLGDTAGVPRNSAGSIGGGVSPVRPSAALSGSIFTSSKAPRWSTSRTPNQATEVAMTVAPTHTATKPSFCRMR